MKATLDRYLAILDIGHGNCAVLKDDEGVAVIDTGLGPGLLQFLKDNSIGTVDLVLLSHSDQDHISGLIHLLASEEFKVGRVRLNTDAAKKSDLWKNLLYELEQQEAMGKLNWEVRLTADSMERFSVGRVQIDVLAPGKALAALGPGNKDDEGRHISANSVSGVVALIQDNEAVAVLPADIDETGLADLTRRRGQFQLETGLLVYPHHGGLSGGVGHTAHFAETMCRLFPPRVVAFSIGRGQYGTPRPEVVAAVRNTVADVRVACTQLSLHCSQSVPLSPSEHLLPVYSQGRDECHCCAGTMLIDLNADTEVLPAAGNHQAFLSKIASTALCQRADARK